MQALSWGGLEQSLRRTVRLASQVPTAPCGLRRPLTSCVPLGGSVQQDQCLDISQVQHKSSEVSTVNLSSRCN